ncbi:hypothetical protein PT974_12245 [Cladobotryum mycophilum]|uniref:Nucleoside phosphorylase domain-containing protein n=1 Tax=Cladobotryum mycophilum TaxID=491253 RepID=A0ABR0S7H0_9HYPO
MAAETEIETKTYADYNVGWICALPKEQIAATAMLDRRHGNLPKPANDINTYTLGSIGHHNIVIVGLPLGKYGTISAATIVTSMIRTFPNIKIGLMVGIGGGIPSNEHAGGQHSGVVQWDQGKAMQEGRFERTGSLNNPPNSILTALNNLQTNHEMTGSKIPDYLDEMAQQYPRLANDYARSESLQDVLFQPDYHHVAGPGTACQACDTSKIIEREPQEMQVHYGLIASGNQVIKDSILRDRLNEQLGGRILCVEMEAAGLMDNFPCLQKHAAAVAAAYAKELLGCVHPVDVAGERPIREVFQETSDGIDDAYKKIEHRVRTSKRELQDLRDAFVSAFFSR